jgi:DNA topoisomerase-2
VAAKEVEKAEAQGLTEFFKLTSKINTSNMICFDFDGKIKKYNSPEEIIEEFYPKRLAFYQKRKASTARLSIYRSDRSNGFLDVGLPRERTAITVREAFQSSALCEDDHQQGIGGVQP